MAWGFADGGRTTLLHRDSQSSEGVSSGKESEPQGVLTTSSLELNFDKSFFKPHGGVGGGMSWAGVDNSVREGTLNDAHGYGVV